MIRPIEDSWRETIHFLTSTEFAEDGSGDVIASCTCGETHVYPNPRSAAVVRNRFEHDA